MKRSSFKHTKPVSWMKLGSLCLIGFALGACSMGKDYERAELNLPESFSQAATEAEAQTDSRWWQTLGDPALNRFVEEAGASNLDLRQARARLRAATARRRSATALLLPLLNATAGNQRFKLSGNGANPVAPLANAGFASLTGEASSLGVQASWELDLFGRNRRAREAAIAGELATEQQLRAAALSVAAATANSYLQWRGLQAQRLLVEELIAVEEQETKLFQARGRLGLASAVEVANANAALAIARASLPPLRSAERESAAGLGILLGKDVGSMLAELEALDGEQRSLRLEQRVPAGLPIELLARRSDVRAAELELVAANAQVGSAQAARYPNLSLTGNAGQESVDFADIFASGSRNWAFTPNLIFPVFAGGAVYAAIESARAEREAAQARFEQAVLTALAEVETGLTRYAQAQLQRRALADAQQSAQDAVSAAGVLQEQGLADALPVLATRRAYLARKSALIDSETATAQALVGLYRALGGGWQTLL